MNFRQIKPFYRVKSMDQGLAAVHSNSKIQKQVPLLNKRVRVPQNADILWILSTDCKTIPKLISSNHVSNYKSLNKI